MNAPAALYVEPVRKTIRVQAPPVRAFEIFTTNMHRWWPATYSINPTKAPIAAIVMERRMGGRWYERGADGSECDWAGWSFGNLPRGSCWRGRSRPRGNTIRRWSRRSKSASSHKARA